MPEITKNINSNLWGALMDAQASVSSVAKDAKNDWGKYGYTSAEEMISQCRRALLSHGLVFARTNWSLHDDKVVSHFCLVHPKSGETLEFGNDMIVVASKNPDKSVLAALTTVMNYALRDLLLIPRVDEKQPEIDNRLSDDILDTPKAYVPDVVESSIKPAPDWMVKCFAIVEGEKPDPGEYKKRLLGAAEQNYGEQFGSIADLPEEYLVKVFEHHGWKVRFDQHNVEKEAL